MSESRYYDQPGYMAAERKTLEAIWDLACDAFPDVYDRSDVSPRPLLHDVGLMIAMQMLPTRKWHVAMGMVRPAWYNLPARIRFGFMVRRAKREVRDTFDLRMEAQAIRAFRGR